VTLPALSEGFVDVQSEAPGLRFLQASLKGSSIGVYMANGLYEILPNRPFRKRVVNSSKKDRKLPTLRSSDRYCHTQWVSSRCEGCVVEVLPVPRPPHISGTRKSARNADKASQYVGREVGPGTLHRAPHQADFRGESRLLEALVAGPKTQGVTPAY
jgi:hypothetical protein